jgi:4-amino-4-deoxy-L-arabinose transferase-like glycosyltransferase
VIRHTEVRLIIADRVESQPSLRERLSERLARPSTTAFLGSTVAVAFLIRIVVVCFAFHEVANPINTHDQFGWEMGWTARSLFMGRGFGSPFQHLSGPSALVPPLYPYILSVIFKLFGLYTLPAAFATLTFNSVLSALTCIPVYGAAREGLGRRTARWATIGWAIYPFGIYFSADRVWDYALTAFLFACCFWWVQRLHRTQGKIRWVLFGLLYGVTALSNPSIVSMLPFLLLLAMGRRWQMGGRALARGLFAVILPWTIRNYRVMHIVCPLRDGFWLEFYAGNAGDTSVSNPAWAHPASNSAEMDKYLQMGEIAYLDQKHELALDNVRHNKLLFLEVTARRFVRFWTGYWSFSSGYLKYEPMDVPNVPFCTALTIVMLFGIRWWWRERRETFLPYGLLLLLFPAPYYLTHASMDYRAPIEPEIVILIAAGLNALTQRKRLTVHQGESQAEPHADTEASWNAARSRASL